MNDLLVPPPPVIDDIRHLLCVWKIDRVAGERKLERICCCCWLIEATARPGWLGTWAWTACLLLLALSSGGVSTAADTRGAS
jgi:hypothetical protein